MVSLKSEELEDYEPLTASPTRTRDELKLLEKLTFTFDMDREPSGSSRAHHTSRSNQRSRSDSASAQSGGANTVSKYSCHLLYSIQTQYSQLYRMQLCWRNLRLLLITAA